MCAVENQKLDRREFLKRAGVAAAGLGLMACAPAAAPTATPTKAAAAAPTAAAKAPLPTPTPSDAEMAAKLYEAAKKEGEVMVYTAGTSQEWEELAAEFSKKYPGIKTAAFPGTSEAIRDKILTEARAKKAIGEVLLRTTFDDTYTFTKEAVLEPYLSPETKNYEKSHYDPNGLWVINNYIVDVIEYNTQAISKDQVPKGYQDLLKPEYKGKLGLEASAIPWFTSMLTIMGKDKGLEYMKKLVEQKPRLVSGHTNLHKLVVSGEIPISVYMYHFRPIVDKAKGAPVEWVDPLEVTPTLPTFVALLKNVSHPNAARLMIDFILSDVGADVMTKQGWIPTRKGANLGDLGPASKVDALIINDPNWGKEVSENEKTFRDIFGKA